MTSFVVDASVAVKWVAVEPGREAAADLLTPPGWAGAGVSRITTAVNTIAPRVAILF